MIGRFNTNYSSLRGAFSATKQSVQFKQIASSFLLAMTVLFFCTHKTFAQKNTYQVQLHLTQTSDYCGGAKPPEEILQQLNTPKPFPNKQVVIKEGFKNKNGELIGKITKVATSDSLGNIVVALRKGRTYFIIDGDKKIMPVNTAQSHYDSLCWKKHSNTPDYVLSLKSKPITVKAINFKKYCPWKMPCVNYTGPLPPAAKPRN